MGCTTEPTLRRLTQILSRQDPPEFGPGYVPGLLATREEAPSESRFATYYWPRVGREVHFVSTPEMKVGVIALYCPSVFEMQEQRVIHFDTRPHPLSGHPKARDSQLPHMRGACEVAQSLGLLRYYPTVRTQVDGVPCVVPYVYLGDLLVFVTGPRGHYCVNLNVKQRRVDFTLPLQAEVRSKDLEAARQEAIARHTIERVRYEEVGIRTVEIAADEEVDDQLFHTMRGVIAWQKRSCTLPGTARYEALESFRAGALAGHSALEVITRLCRSSTSLSAYQLKVLFYQAIWERALRLDLFRPILMDEPMQPEQRDVLTEYSHWFTQA